MGRPFGSYNMKAHNRMLGQLRTDAARRRNAKALDALRAYPHPLPTDLTALFAIIGSQRGMFPPSVLLTLARQVRKEKA